MVNEHGTCEKMSEEVKDNLTKTLTLKDGESSTRMLILTGGVQTSAIDMI